MNLDELSNFFGLTAEVVIGILAFQGIATTFIFSRKGEWTYMDVWEFVWLIFLNLVAELVCVFNIFLLITITDKQVFLESSFNFIIVNLCITTSLAIYYLKKSKERTLIDKVFEDEMNQEHNKFFFMIYYLIMFLPIILPLIYYNTSWISLDLLLYFICFFPWLFCALSFTCFYNLIHNALRVVDEDKLETPVIG